MAPKAPAKLSRQERLAKLAEKIRNTDMGGSGSAGFWSPKEGRNVIRILPEVKDMEFFFQEVGRHNFPPDGKKSCYCPRFTSAGELPCPVCETVDDLYKSGIPSNKELAGQLRARKMYWMNIIVRGKEANNEGDTGPFIYTPGVTVFQQITTLINDPDYGDIMDIHDGLDITIERTGKGLDTEYQVTPRRTSSPLAATQEKIDEWLEAARNLLYVQLTENKEEDKEIVGNHAIFVLPYDRLTREMNLDSEVADEDAIEEDAELEEVPAKKAVAKGKRPAPVEEDEDEVDEEEEEDEEPVRKPAAKAEVEKRMARRSLRPR